jgi:kinesin family protein 11
VTAGTKRKERDFDVLDVSTGEETNINVVVRCRGRNQREIKENSTYVVKADSVKGKSIELLMGSNAISNKSYGFDRVFSQAADQSMIFEDTVRPILEEVCYYYQAMRLKLVSPVLT